MNAPERYIQTIKTTLVMSPVIASLNITVERTLADRGYFRARLRLTNGDFLEISEFFIVWAGGCVTQEYRHQWMNASQTQLIKRWDNATHFPDMPAFPHHIHVGSEFNVIPGKSMNILDLIAEIESELAS